MPENKRLGAVGGQAVLEGVMMKSGDDLAIAVRREDGRIVTKKKIFRSVRKKYKVLDLPVIRGVVNFVEMMSMSMSTLNDSAEMMGFDEEINREAKEKAAKSGKKAKEIPFTAIASVVGVLLGLALSFALFFFLPTFTSKQITKVVELGWFINLTEGLIRLSIFVIYILLVSLMKDIRRTFEYHGAEHMAVFCYESGEALTVENVKKFSRFHPRCGTSFLIVMMIIGVAISSVIPLSFGTAARLGIKLCLFPFVIGIGYEFLRFAGRHDNAFIRILSAPGLWVQRLTTKKPDDKEIECAVRALMLALPAEFPQAAAEHEAELAAETAAKAAGKASDAQISAKA